MKFMIYLVHRSAQTLQQIEYVQENLGDKLLDLLKFKLTFKEYISLISWLLDNCNHSKLPVTSRVEDSMQW